MERMGKDTNQIFTILPLFWFPRKKENQYKPHLLRIALPSPQPSFSRKHCNTTPCSEAKFLLVFYFLFKIRRKKLSPALCQRQKRILKMMLVKSRAGTLSQPPNVTSAQQSCNTGCTFSLCTSVSFRFLWRSFEGCDLSGWPLDIMVGDHPLCQPTQCLHPHYGHENFQVTLL